MADTPHDVRPIVAEEDGCPGMSGPTAADTPHGKRPIVLDTPCGKGPIVDKEKV